MIPYYLSNTDLEKIERGEEISLWWGCQMQIGKKRWIYLESAEELKELILWLQKAGANIVTHPMKKD